MRIVSRLLDLLFPPRATERLVREASREDVLRLLSPALVPGVLRATALMRYDAPLAQALIIEAKFYGNERAILYLGELLREYLLEWSADRIPGERMVFAPIPLSAERKKKRRYNQAERIARSAIPGTGITLRTDLISRTRDTVPQTKLSGSERRKNMRGAFHAAPLDTSHTYIVVDDVTTTGATLFAAAEALKEAGPGDIILLALAQ